MSRHHLELYSTGRHGCWGACSCGWKSKRYTSTVGAHVEFGQHLTPGVAHQVTAVAVEPADPWDACLDVDPFTGQPEHVHGESCVSDQCISTEEMG